MAELAYLTAVYKLGRDYHSGQWSKGYRLLCIADQRARRQGISLGRIVEQLETDRLYKKGCRFRQLVAFWLFNLRKHRTEL